MFNWAGWTGFSSLFSWEVYFYSHKLHDFLFNCPRFCKAVFINSFFFVEPTRSPNSHLINDLMWSDLRLELMDILGVFLFSLLLNCSFFQFCVLLFLVTPWIVATVRLSIKGIQILKKYLMNLCVGAKITLSCSKWAFFIAFSRSIVFIYLPSLNIN